MPQVTCDTPVLKVPHLAAKFDTNVLSNSLVVLIGDYLEARILQQLHYWCFSEYGIVINGKRWIYKSIRELLLEVLIGFSNWQIRKAILSLVTKGLLVREHLFKEHHGHNFAPKNRTYYYSINYEKLEEFAQPQNAETLENVRFVSPTNQFCGSSENQFCEQPQNKTDNTSIKNNSIDQSHPTLPCVSVLEKPLNQREDSNPVQIETVLDRPVKNKVNSTESKVIEQETSSAAKKEIVKKNNLDKNLTKPKPKVEKTKPGTKPKKKSLAPWKDEGEFKRFYRALIQALSRVANARSPEGLAQTIIRQLRSGIPHSYWDDFKAGLPIGTSLQKEWEVQPGVPYPMFLEYLAEKLKGGHDGVEKAYQGALKILEQPKQAQVFWSQFKRSVINVSEQVENDRALGVSNPHTPTWTRERVEPSTEEAATAGAKIMEVNNTAQKAISASTNPQLEGIREVTTTDPWIDESQTDSQTESSSDSGSDSPQMSLREMFTLKFGKCNPKGFVKKMPQVSQEEAEAEAAKEELANRKLKVNISRMTIAEINESLQDPILRKELTPQLWDSDYELITDELGQIIGIERST